MKRLPKIILMLALQASMAACSGNGGSPPATQTGVKLEDREQKDILHWSPLPNGSPDTLPSETSASPNGASLGTSPMMQ